MLKSKNVFQSNEKDLNIFLELDDVYIAVVAYESLSKCSDTERDAEIFIQRLFSKKVKV